MDTLEKFKSYKESGELINSDISNEVSAFKEELLSHEFFSKLGSLLYDLLEAYDISVKVSDISEAMSDINKVLFSIPMPRIQSEKLITEIPPEGIIIDQPGVYKFAKSKKISWSPNSDTACGIIILCDNVTLDLQQSDLNAVVQDSSKHLIGIAVYYASNVTIMNGSLTNMCLYGIQAEMVEYLTIDSINISGLEYKNTNIRNACPTGVQIKTARNVKVVDCKMEYFYVTADACSGIQFLNTLYGEVKNCSVSNLYNYAGGINGFSYAMSQGIKTKNCHAESIQSHFGCNIRTIGHTVLGFIPVFCDDFEFENCSAKNIIGSCDDCHGMSVFLDMNVTVKNFYAEHVKDGVTQFNTGAKATGLEVYGIDVSLTDCRVDNIRAINPQDKVSTGFSVWGENIALSRCSASNVYVNNLQDQNIIIGMGTGFGWAPDPRLYAIGAKNVTYQSCEAINCQVGFDTWNHINGTWRDLTYYNCAINILVEPGGVRTLYGTPCTECNPPVTVKVHNQAKNNVYPGSAENQLLSAKPAYSTSDSVIKYAYPTGNINGLSFPTALSRLESVKSQWWFYVGLLEDDQGDDHSFELTFIEPNSNVLLDGLCLTAVDFDFSFSSKGNHFHVTSSYGGDEPENVLQSVINALGFGSVKSQAEDYHINVDLLSGTTVRVSYDAESSRPSASMYTGQIGQPGSAYILEGQGSTWLWKYSKDEKAETAPYQYSLKVHVIDERGLVPEGLGSYVGIDPIHQAGDTKNSSVEYAQPRLSVISWEVTITRHAEWWPLSQWEQFEGFEESYHFHGDSRDHSGDVSHLWLDRQALFDAPTSYRACKANQIVEILAKAQSILEPQGRSILNEVKQEGKSLPSDSLKGKLASHIASLSSKSPASKQLYLGCWLPVVLTKGAYAGSTLLFVAFWNKAHSVGNYDTDKGDAKPASFMNLYTGILGPNAIDTYSAYAISDLLNPYQAIDPQVNDQGNNYRIQFTKQFQKVGDSPYPQCWACEIEVTVKAFSQARYVLSAYAKRAGREEACGVDQDLTFTIKTVTPYTRTTMLSSSLGAPIYEGASRIYMKDGTEVGSGWVEQMVTPPNPK